VCSVTHTESIGNVLAGTTLYYAAFSNPLIASWLYIIGSCGFLGVDVQEFFTYWTVDFYLAVNICLSMIGSTLYILGSIGFLPWLETKDPINPTHPMGIWGFILGSFFIGVSQVWKVYRIGTMSDPQPKDGVSIRPLLGGHEGYNDESLGSSANSDECCTFSLRNYWRNIDNASSLGVELSACLGGWFFFFGTIFYKYAQGRDSDPFTFDDILWIWEAGSFWFTMGSIFLAYRHFVLGF